MDAWCSLHEAYPRFVFIYDHSCHTGCRVLFSHVLIEESLASFCFSMSPLDILDSSSSFILLWALYTYCNIRWSKLISFTLCVANFLPQNVRPYWFEHSIMHYVYQLVFVNAGSKDMIRVESHLPLFHVQTGKSFTPGLIKRKVQRRTAMYVDGGQTGYSS